MIIIPDFYFFEFHERINCEAKHSSAIIESPLRNAIYAEYEYSFRQHVANITEHTTCQCSVLTLLIINQFGRRKGQLSEIFKALFLCDRMYRASAYFVRYLLCCG